MKKIIINLIGFFLRKTNILFSIYMNNWIIKRLGKSGDKSSICYPFNIIGEKNIFIEDGAIIGVGATIYTKNAKLFIGKKSFTGPNLTIISGDHPYVPEKYMIDIEKKSLPNFKDFDSDIIIEQDVWIGANVTILKGVRIGRCAIVAAGSVVIHDIPPYAISGGVPAKVLKFKWDIDDILIHERYLYENINERMTKEQVAQMLNFYSHKI